jgi:hypothetical protein
VAQDMARVEYADVVGVAICHDLMQNCLLKGLIPRQLRIAGMLAGMLAGMASIWNHSAGGLLVACMSRDQGCCSWQQEHTMVTEGGALLPLALASLPGCCSL